MASHLATQALEEICKRETSRKTLMVNNILAFQIGFHHIGQYPQKPSINSAIVIEGGTDLSLPFIERSQQRKNIQSN